jgi:hypothetical protein
VRLRPADYPFVRMMGVHVEHGLLLLVDFNDGRMFRAFSFRQKVFPVRGCREYRFDDPKVSPDV